MADNLPPGPYNYMTTAPLDGDDGRGHVYLIDANGRKIASIWGAAAEKMALVGWIIEASNGELSETPPTLKEDPALPPGPDHG